MKSVCEDFKKDCKSAGLTKTSDIILEAKSYITKDTTYSLSPGKTPSGKESIEYFLKENKKDIVPIMRRQPLCCCAVWESRHVTSRVCMSVKMNWQLSKR